MRCCPICKSEALEETAVCSACGAQLEGDPPLRKVGRRKRIRLLVIIAGSIVACLIIIAVIGLITYEPFDPMRRVGPFSHTTDYTIQYENVLNVMFDNEWTVLSMEERFDEGEEACGCGIPGINPHTYLVWIIEYRDGNNDVRFFEFDNRSGLPSQITRHVTRYIADYYEENFFNVFMMDIQLAGSRNVVGFLPQNFSYSTGEDIRPIRERERLARNYIQRLDTPRGAINLAQLTPANVFEMFPMYLSISVRFGGSVGHEQSFEESVMERVEDMIDEMNRFTNYSLNASVNLGYREIIDLHTGTRQRRWEYVQGEQLSGVSPMHYDRYVFDSYRGAFW